MKMAEESEPKKEDSRKEDKESETAAEKDEKADVEEIYTLEILPVIKEAQQHHGLRHGDYQRYRQYCARRLSRIRHSLNFVLGNRHGYKGKKINEEVVNSVRYLYIPLMNAERAWSYAMELKLLANTEPRKKFHMIRKLQKAVSYAEELLKLCEIIDKVDARTKLEAQAYCYMMTANLKFEVQDWQTAIDLYGKARTIYEKLAGAFIDDMKAMYLQKVEEIAPNIRYCAYNLGQASVDINELVKLRMSAVGQDLLVAKIDAAINQTREKLASSVGEVTWRGRTIPVKNEKARIFILRLQDKEQELERNDDFEGKMSVYDNLLMECKEALQSAKEEITSELGHGKAKGQRNETVISQLNYVQAYLSYLRHTLMIERNLVLTESLKAKIPAIVVGDVKAAGRGKMAKPEDLVKLYDSIIQSLAEIGQIPCLEEDTSVADELEAQTTGYKAHRCFYIAQSYQSGKKWSEAVGLYERSMAYITMALALYQGKTESFKGEVESLQELSAMANGHKCAAHAAHILESSAIEEGVEKIKIIDKPMNERLDVYQEETSSSLKKPNLVNFPPNFEPVPCKPLFFDLALNHVEMPDLEERVEKKKEPGGITGFVKGWLWGK